MNEYLFLARLRPLGSVVRVELPGGFPRISFKVAGGHEEPSTLDILVNGPNIVLRVQTPEPVADIGTLHHQVEELALTFFDSVTYFTGWAVDIEITGVLTGNSGLLRYDARSEALERAASNVAFEPAAFVALAGRTPALRRAVADLRRAVAHPVDSAFFAYRAVEDIRQDFQEAHGDDTDAAWADLRTALNVSKSFLTAMTARSKERRHGASRPISKAEREELMVRARNVIHRFAVFVHTDRSPLDPTEYPLLDEKAPDGAGEPTTPTG